MNDYSWFMSIIMLNIGKCTYMVISRKRFPIQPVSLVSNSPGESVHLNIRVCGYLMISSGLNISSR